MSLEVTKSSLQSWRTPRNQEKFQKLATRIRPEDRSKQFEDGTFRVDTGRLLCSVCNVTVDFTRKHTCLKHLNSNTHKRRKEQQVFASAKRASLENLDVSTGGTSERQVFLTGLVDAFAGANIPLHALDNRNLRSFLQANFNSETIPTASHLRRFFLPKAFEAHFIALKRCLANRGALAIVCDETTDAEDRYILNVLAVPSCEKQGDKLDALLLECVVLEKTNYKTVSEAILRVLFKYEIPTLKISAFVTDNAAYMHKAWNCSLRPVLLNGVHVTCTAHILNLICEVWVSSFQETNRLVSAIKKAFTASPARKARFKQFLREKGAPQKLPPAPVLTRWNTWFGAVLYHADHLEDYSEFFSRELGSSASSNTSEIIILCGSVDVRQQLDQLRIYAPHLMAILKKYEGTDIKAHLVIDDLTQLIEWFDASYTDTENLACTATALRKSSRKLQSYICADSAERFCQPAAFFFRACRVFDPSRAKNPPNAGQLCIRKCAPV
ncbi:uncharacterized protein LOC100904016 [Galendromus occidentalis]|uniref:Uncharacterized protein LOC100904016 n=1 Tax=Galendromus occidentalis TaxID=34638 RepID=A0AAJ6QN46_9ACAR|nr:uncharacterized protein LOC100904016 [Galendromus occidentalis]